MTVFGEKFWKGSKSWFKIWGYTIILAIVIIAIAIYNMTDKRGIAQVLILFIGLGITATISWALLGVAITSGLHSACGVMCAVVGSGAYMYLTKNTIGNKTVINFVKKQYSTEPGKL